jgi:hypothetical protein
MPDATYFARKAERCRDLLKLARVPEVIEQLRLWASEFETEAQNSARRAPHKRAAASTLRHRTRHWRG